MENSDKLEVLNGAQDDLNNIETHLVAITILFNNDYVLGYKKELTNSLEKFFGGGFIEVQDRAIYVLRDTREEFTPSITEENKHAEVSIIIHDLAYGKYKLDLTKLFREIFGSEFLIQDNGWLLCLYKNLNYRPIEFDVDIRPSSNSSRSDVRFHRVCDVSTTDARTKNVNANRVTGQKCFNCLGSHSLRDCKQRKNYQEIDKNRNIFNNTKVKGPGRYHLDDCQKFGKFVPGHLSKDLRRALLLKPNQIPLHIYKMRELGYPPGWLAEAKVSHSGVSVYISEGKTEPIPGEEDGEIIDTEPAAEYDISKIIEFPGFNVPFEGDDKIEDDRFPPISAAQSKETMIEELLPNAAKAYKKRVYSSISSNSPQHLTPSQSPKPSPESSLLSSSSASVFNLGTPILSSASPFTHLPDRVKFSHLISDVINFENLPDATGTYDKVFESIKKIRDYNAQQLNK